MDNFSEKLAVITGGANGMGRHIALQLAAEGCDVAICDLSEDDMANTAANIREQSANVKVTTHTADVGSEEAILRFRDEVVEQHDTDHVELVFNNAGIGGGPSMFTSTRDDWDRTFNIVWGGVYWGTRAFLPLLQAADEGHLVNTSSVNGFWASLGAEQPHTAYSAAKFAVKGFTEALIGDLRVNAPHVGVSVVMPGHVGTKIVTSSMRHGAVEFNDEERLMRDAAAEMFENNALTSAADAATIILDGVRNNQWRILVGPDAVALDQLVRSRPEDMYDPAATQDIMRAFQASGDGNVLDK